MSGIYLPGWNWLARARVAGRIARLAAVAEHGWENLALVERGRLMLWLPVCIAIGDLLYFLPRDEPSMLVPLVLLGLAGVLFVPAGLPRAVGLTFAAVAVGFLAAVLAGRLAPPMPPLPRAAVALSGVVSLAEDLPDGGRRVTLTEASWPGQPPIARSLRVRLRPDDTAILAEGDRIAARAQLFPPPPPAYPGGRDLQRDAFYSDHAGSGRALEPVRVVAHGAADGLSARWQGLRAGIARVAVAQLGPRLGGIGATLLTGLGAAIAPADRDAFRDSGLAHLLAVAGLHIAAVMGFVYWVTRRLLAAIEPLALRVPVPKLAMLAALAAGFGYLCLTGAHLPIQRSFTMAAMVVLALLVGRRALSLRALALAAMAILLISPAALFSVGFQMSFAAVLALIAGHAALRTRMGGLADRPALAHLARLALTSLLAGAAALPFTMAHFGQVQLWFVLANLVAVPLTALLIMPAGLVALLLMPLGLEQIGFYPMGLGIRAVLYIAQLCAALPAATLPTPTLPGAGLALVGLGLAWLGLWRSRLRLVGVPMLVVGMASPWLVTPPDLLLSADGRMAAVKLPDGVVLRGTRAGGFVAGQWLELWGLRGAAVADRCIGGDCRAGPVLLAGKGAAAPELCVGARLVLVMPGGQDGCSGALPRLVGRAVARDGAVAVWLTASGPALLTEAALRGTRPWVPPPQPLHPAPVVDQAMALADTPPAD